MSSSITAQKEYTETVDQNTNQTMYTSSIKLNSATISFKPSLRKTVKKIKVILEGNLSINNSKAFVKQIQPVFEDFEKIDFHLTQVESIDLSFIQSLYHLKMFHEQDGKEVTIDSEISGELKSMVINSGFEDLLFIPKLV
jgi:anti-anti-sigma regulatory factor